MTKESHTFGRGGELIRCTVTWLDDLPERAESVNFFGRSTVQRNGGGLFPASQIPEVCFNMTQEVAQTYLDEHPMQRLWESLTITPDDKITDSDLDRLAHIPELTRVNLLSDRITDAGVSRLTLLHSLDNLCIYSKSLTDQCLKDITQLQSLRMLDMQGSHGISPSSFADAVRQLTNLTNSWPPRLEAGYRFVSYKSKP